MDKKELGLTILAIIAAGASVNFLILGTAGVVPFLEYRNYVLVPSLFIILFIAIYGYKKNKRLANRLVTGLWIGLVATLALEAVRVPSISAQWIPHDDMIAFPGQLLTNPPTIENFNAMISPHGGRDMHDTDIMKKSSSNTIGVFKLLQEEPKHGEHDEMKDVSPHPTGSNVTKGHDEQLPHSASQSEQESAEAAEHDVEHAGDAMDHPTQPTTSAMIVGGLYHFWNGATMAAAYSLVVGKGRWYYGLVWGFIIHVGMMLAPWMLAMAGPFGINYGSGYSIFTASLIAHLAYGAVVGILAQRFVREKGSIVTLLRQAQTGG